MLGAQALARDIQLRNDEVSLDSPAPVAHASDTVWVLNENFDSVEPGNWPDGWASIDETAIEDPSYWHVDTRNAYEGSYAWWCGLDAGVWAGYGNSWRQVLDLDFDLTNASGIVGLNLMQYVDSEFDQPEPPHDAWDGGTVRISTDGGTTWDFLAPEGGFPYNDIYAFWLQSGETETVPGFSGLFSGANYEELNYNLTDYTGMTGTIRFDFASDQFLSSEDGGFPGDAAWFIDNVRIGSRTGDIYFEDDMEGAMKPEWRPSAGTVDPSGDWWMTVDSTHPQPDGADVYTSSPNGAFVGDPESSQGDGSYYVGDHSLRPLANLLEFPPVDLSDPDLLGANVRWNERHTGDGAGGYLAFQVSTNGGNLWVELEQRAPAGRSDWASKAYSLSAYRGYSDLRLRLRAASGTAPEHYVYWYVDDVEVFYTKLPTGVENETPGVGRMVTALHEASPNPFNPHTSIGYSLAEAAPVTLAIYDVSGRRVRTLVRATQAAGEHSVVWDGTDERGSTLASGIYTARLETGAQVETRRLVMLK